MLSTIGYSLELLSLILCAVGAGIAFVAGARRSLRGLEWSRRIALGYALTMVAATFTMWYALLSDDFSVSYVAQVGSLATPTHIAIFSLWSSLEGSILFWGFVLALYTAGFAYLQRRGHEDYLAYSLGVIFCVGAFFSYMLAGPSNPFLPTPMPIPTDGPGPNNLLQNHILMAVHPPTLYLGYVGMTIPFAMGMAALLRGQLGPTWLLPMRNWLLLPTAFLTLSIMLGGWWAYEVLGWGGYWAWDPVENASFLPWLTAVAAIHSAMVQQRRGTLKAWTTILILVTFLLTILGTFLTRAGVIASVHSFTQSPIGPLFLVFLCICLLAVVVVLSLRIDTLQSEPGKQGTWSREGAFLVNNLLLVAITFTVLVGTLYPILAEAIRGTKVTVGEPWFNRYSLPMFLALVLLVGIGPALPWGRGSSSTVRKALVTPLIGAAIAVALALVMSVRDLYLLFTCAVVGYSLWVTFAQLSLPTRIRRKRGEGTATAVVKSARLSPRRVGAYLTHLGLLLTAGAIAISSTFQSSNEATLAPGQSMEIDSYSLTYLKTESIQHPHMLQQRASVVVERNGKTLGQLGPSLNIYPTQRDPLGSPSVHSTAAHDLYLTLQSIGGNGIGLRAIVTPAVYWVWIGVFVMFFGTLLCLVPAPVATASSLPKGLDRKDQPEGSPA